MGTHPLSDYPRMVRVKEWKQIGQQLFGPDVTQWKFVCPNCKEVSTVQDAVNTFGAITKPSVGTCCPKCRDDVRPRRDYGPETCYRVLFMQEDAPAFQIPDTGSFQYVMPFWAPDPKETPGEAAVREVIETVGDPVPPAPVQAPPPAKKGGPIGYGFKF